MIEGSRALPGSGGRRRGRRPRTAGGPVRERIPPRLRLAVGLLLALLPVLPARAAAQGPRLQGRLVLGADSVGLEGGTVVLHRVTSDTGRALDSARTGAGGAFTFRLPPSDSQDVYLVTARHDGVLYLGPPVHGGEPPADYRVVVFPSEGAADGSSLSLRSRTLVMTPEGDGVRVMDVLDVRGAPGRTLVGPGGAGDGVPGERPGGAAAGGGGGEDGGDGAAGGVARAPWWSVALPRGARDRAVLPGPVGPEEVRFASGEARLSAVVPPGGQRVALGYAVPRDRPLELVTRHAVETLEVLVPEGPAVRVTGLERIEPLRLRSSRMARYRGRGVAAGDTVRVAVGGGPAGGSSPGGWIALGLGAVLAAAAGWSWYSGAGAADEAGEPSGTGGAP